MQERRVDGRQPVEVILRHVAILPALSFDARLLIRDTTRGRCGYGNAGSQSPACSACRKKGSGTEWIGSLARSGPNSRTI